MEATEEFRKLFGTFKDKEAVTMEGTAELIQEVLNLDCGSGTLMASLTAAYTVDSATQMVNAGFRKAGTYKVSSFTRVVQQMNGCT